MIKDHAYDAGFPRDDSEGCIEWIEESYDGPQVCGHPEDEHERSEYPSERAPGDMHEPKPYTGPLDWPSVLLD